jgi:acyl-CoA synthetase (AMP-forming)/AMP-acid ligase II
VQEDVEGGGAGRSRDGEVAEGDPAEVVAFVKARIGGVKAPKAVHVWSDLPRSKVGKVLKGEIKADLRREVPR